MVASKKSSSSLSNHFPYSKSNYICFDLLLLIFKWFPIQTLLICRCVCKPWKEIIDSTSFILNRISLQEPRILLQRQNFEYLLLDPKNRPFYDTLTGPEGFVGSQLGHLHAVGTAHGVICLYDNGSNLLLWNPSIRRHLRVPLPASELAACHNTDYFKYCGFWIDPYTKHFKVVIFFISPHEKGGWLFSSRDQTWREISAGEMDCLGDDFDTVCRSPQVMIDGVAHWFVANAHEYYGGRIVYFDFAQDKFGRIDLPELVRGWGVNFHVFKCNSFLSVVNSEEWCFEVWLFENGSWGKMSCFSLIEGMVQVFCVMDLTIGEYGGGLALGSTNKGEVVLYDGEYGGFTVPLRPRKEGGYDEEDEYIALNIDDGPIFSFAYDFVESLMFPDLKCISSVN